MVLNFLPILLFLVIAPQKSAIRSISGYWLVTIDNTNQVRDWNRIFYFEKCSKSDKAMQQCKGHFGWAEFDGVYLNLYDKNYLSYGILEEMDENGRGKLLLSGIEYYFTLKSKNKLLRLVSVETGDLVMEMEKVPRSEIKRPK